MPWKHARLRCSGSVCSRLRPSSPPPSPRPRPPLALPSPSLATHLPAESSQDAPRSSLQVPHCAPHAHCTTRARSEPRARCGAPVCPAAVALHASCMLHRCGALPRSILRVLSPCGLPFTDGRLAHRCSAAHLSAACALSGGSAWGCVSAPVVSGQRRSPHTGAKVRSCAPAD